MSTPSSAASARCAEGRGSLVDGLSETDLAFEHPIPDPELRAVMETGEEDPDRLELLEGRSGRAARRE